MKKLFWTLIILSALYFLAFFVDRALAVDIHIGWTRMYGAESYVVKVKNITDDYTFAPVDVGLKQSFKQDLAEDKEHSIEIIPVIGGAEADPLIDMTIKVKRPQSYTIE